MKIDILDISEVRWPETGHFWSGDYRLIYPGNANGQGGVGIALNKEYGHQIISSWAYNDRIIMIKLRSKPKETMLIQVYMPTTNHTDEVEDLYE